MCNATGIAFGERTLTKGDIGGREILEVGALDVNGSLRPHVETLGPARYVGVDIEHGPRVDEVVDARDLVKRFGPASFDVVLSTEMLEHVRDWPTVVANLKGVLRPGGVLLITTRSIGFPYHGFPFDFWRYEPDDISAIFGDLDIAVIERDTASPGVFMLARQRSPVVERTPAVALHSMITGRREIRVSDTQVRLFNLRQRLGPIVARVRDGAVSAAGGIVGIVRVRVLRPVWIRLPVSVRRPIRQALGRGPARRAR
jgi:SAM-dependent methyltransferase